jgi:hypothetical protein
MMEKELIGSLEETIGKFGDTTPLTKISVKWAEFCIRSLKGDLLRKGLEISAAITDYDITVRGL